MLTMRLLKWHAAVSTPSLLVLALMAIADSDSAKHIDEITVQRIRVLDSEGRERVTIAGEFAPRRAELAGVLFHNQEGNEAGGLVYYGKRTQDGQIEAGALLTFDQFQEDQILAMEYNQHGDRKRNGIRILDRPDEMSDRVLEFYRAMEAAQSDDERSEIKRRMLPTIPAEERSAPRLYVGRDVQGSSMVELCDARGKPRLLLRVEADGRASIAFLDEQGQVVRTIEP